MSDIIKLTLKRRSTHFTHSKSRASYDISDLVIDDSIKWTIDTNFSASQFDFKLVFDEKPIIPYTGDIISFSYKKKRIFYGYVFYPKSSIIRYFKQVFLIILINF